MFTSDIQTMYFTARLDRLLKIKKHKYLRSKRFISEVCKIFMDNGFNAFLVCRVNSSENEKKIKEFGLPDCVILNLNTLFTFRKLLVLRMSENKEESMRILGGVNKFIEDINAVEFPFIAFSKLDFNSFVTVIGSGKMALVKASLLRFENPCKGRRFIQKNQAAISAFLTVYDNELSLETQKYAVEGFSDILEKKFRKYE